MLAEKYDERYTVTDYHLWEGEWELVEGRPYAMAPSPMVTHQHSSGKISRQLDEVLEKCQKCQMLYEIDWEVSESTVVRPDLIVICYEPDEKITKKPEIIFEIVSSSSVIRDENLKYELYEQEGVLYYCIVYPWKQIAKLYKLREGKYMKVNDFSDETYNFELGSCTFDFDFSKIWRIK